MTMTDTKKLPVMRIHASGTRVMGSVVQIEGHVCELTHGENVGVGVPMFIGLCSCAEPISDADMKRISDLAIDKLVPEHTRRQIAFSSGADSPATEAELCAALKIAHTKLWELIGEGKLPQPMKRGRNNVWLLQEARQMYAQTLSAANDENKRAPGRRKG